MTAGWFSAMIAGAAQPAQALLFAFLVTALLLHTSASVSSRADFLSVWWIVVAAVEFVSYFTQHAVFGYASEKMVYPESEMIKIRFVESDSNLFEVSSDKKSPFSIARKIPLAN